MITFSISGPLFYQFAAIGKAALILDQQSDEPEMRKNGAWGQLCSSGLGNHCPLALLTWALRFRRDGTVPAPPRRGALSTQGCNWVLPGPGAAPGGPWWSFPLSPSMRSELSSKPPSPLCSL